MTRIFQWKHVQCSVCSIRKTKYPLPTLLFEETLGTLHQQRWFAWTSVIGKRYDNTDRFNCFAQDISLVALVRSCVYSADKTKEKKTSRETLAILPFQHLCSIMFAMVNIVCASKIIPCPESTLSSTATRICTAAHPTAAGREIGKLTKLCRPISC